MTWTTHRLCLGVSGALREATAKGKRNPRALSYANDDAGRAMTWREFEAMLKIERNKGHEVIPMDEGCRPDPCTRKHLGCIGFMYTGERTGCPGHKQETPQ